MDFLYPDLLHSAFTKVNGTFKKGPTTLHKEVGFPTSNLKKIEVLSKQLKRQYSIHLKEVVLLKIKLTVFNLLLKFGNFPL